MGLGEAGVVSVGQNYHAFLGGLRFTKPGVVVCLWALSCNKSSRDRDSWGGVPR